MVLNVELILGMLLVLYAFQTSDSYAISADIYVGCKGSSCVPDMIGSGTSTENQLAIGRGIRNVANLRSGKKHEILDKTNTKFETNDLVKHAFQTLAVEARSPPPPKIPDKGDTPQSGVAAPAPGR